MEPTEKEKHEKIVGDFLKKEEARDASAEKDKASSLSDAEKEKTKAEEKTEEAKKAEETKVDEAKKAEDKAKELKKKVIGLRLRIGKAKKALK